MSNCLDLQSKYTHLLTAKHTFDASLPSAKIKTPNPNAKSGSQLERWDKQSITQSSQAFQALETVYTSLLESTIFELIGHNFETANRILGKDYLGPKALERTFGISLDTKDIPPIPFSYAELLRARELGQFLILRADKASDGSPLTMPKMHELVSKKTKALANITNEWKIKSDFFSVETPRLAWALVSKDTISDSTDKNYLEQTQTFVDHVKNDVFRGQPIPPEYKEAIEEFQIYFTINFKGKSKEQIQKLLSDDTTWYKYAEELSKLKINQLTRQSAVDFLFDELVYFDNTGERIFSNEYTWTKSRSSNGKLVAVGWCGAGGALVNGWGPGNSDGGLGVSFSRSP